MLVQFMSINLLAFPCLVDELCLVHVWSIEWCAEQEGGEAQSADV